jgi:hypothetical protein
MVVTVVVLVDDVESIAVLTKLRLLGSNSKVLKVSIDKGKTRKVNNANDTGKILSKVVRTVSKEYASRNSPTRFYRTVPHNLHNSVLISTGFMKLVDITDDCTDTYRPECEL